MRILIPVDFSPETEILYRFVAALPKPELAEVTLLHVLEAPVIPMQHPAMAEHYARLFGEVKASAEAQLRELAQRPEFAAVQTEAVLLTEADLSVANRIHEYAQANSFDLMLVCSKHLSNLDQLMVGSELRRLLRHSVVPVLCLSPAEEAPKLRRLLYATDLSLQSLSVLPTLHDIAQLLGVELVGANINTPSDFLSDREFRLGQQELAQLLLTDQMAPQDVFAELINYNDRDVVQGLLHCAEDHQADALALATHGRSGLSRMLSGSVTEQVVEETRLPLLVLRIPDEAQ
jgi:nucleotide-binding universal stress UspA family protein